LSHVLQHTSAPTEIISIIEMIDFNDDSASLKALIEKGELPRFIYKYYPSGKNKIEDILIMKSIWFSKASDFNDPFDCRLIIDTDNTPDEIIQHVNYLCSTRDVSAQGYIRVLLNFLNPKYRNEVMNESIQYSVMNSGISCFSKNKNNLLLWAHYSSSHEGYCITFDILEDPSFFMVPVIVKYKSDYPGFNYIREKANLFQFIFGNKSIDWHYEEEIRIVRQDQGPVSINPHAIKKITFGIQSQKDDREKIISMCKNNEFSHVEFELAKKVDKKYKLDFEAIY
jgi:hypothetical protein